MYEWKDDIGNSECLGNGETQYVIYLLDNTGTILLFIINMIRVMME